MYFILYKIILHIYVHIYVERERERERTLQYSKGHWGESSEQNNVRGI